MQTFHIKDQGSKSGQLKEDLATKIIFSERYSYAHYLKYAIQAHQTY